MHQEALEVFSKDSLRSYKAADRIVKLLTKASLVSVFEKTALRNLFNEADQLFKQEFVDGVYTMIHENQERGFTQIVNLLEPYKCAKWPVLSVMLFYYDNQHEVIIKPTTVKKVLLAVEETSFQYTSKVNYTFYKQYREFFNQMKREVDKRLSPTNGHFSGFFMMMLGG